MPSYSLTLADRQKWAFMALAGARTWAKQLAAIMEIEESSYSPVNERLVIFARRSREAGIAGWLPVNPSPCRNLQLFSSDNGRAFLLDVGKEESAEEEYVKMQQALSLVFREAIKGGGFPFHCALFDYRGKGVLLAGSGGAGKSTCCKLSQAPFQPLCDDLCLVVRERRDAFRVHPLPTWSDYLWRRGEGTWRASLSLPLTAVFFLEQADESEINPVGQGEASMLINALARQMFEPSWSYGSVQEKRMLRRKLFQSAGDAARVLPAFMLRFQSSGGFWQGIERVLGP